MGQGIKMFLFRLSQYVNDDYETYSRCVVVAKDPDSAKAMTPYDPDYDLDPSCLYREQAWAPVEDVKVECVGVAADGLREGEVICASFHAG